MKPIIKIENLSKQYRLGTIGTGTISNDLKRWWYNARGKDDPFLKIGESNDRSTKGNSEYVWALKNINLEVMPGEVLGIIGKNGAGKSTLLKILSKVTGPTTGGISFNGRIGSLLEVGTGFHPELTGRENIYLNGAILGMTKTEIKNKLDEIIEFSGCERYIDTPVKRYSSGMTVRLGFAVAAHLEPEILVVDEVLAVGDAEFQKKAIGKMQDVSRNDGRTVLFVSHNMGSVRNLCQNAIILDNGEIIERGKSTDVITNYINQSKTTNSYKSENNTNKNIIILDGNCMIKETSTDFELITNIILLSKIKKSVSIDFKIKDNLGFNVAFGSLGTLDNNLIKLQVGEQQIVCRFDLNFFAEGHYSIDIDITEPNISYEERIENFLFFSVIRKSNNKYRVLKQEWGYGSIEIPLFLL